MPARRRTVSRSSRRPGLWARFRITHAAIIAAVLLVAVAVFQFALAAGAAWGEAAWGGMYPGALPPPMRVASAAAGLVLLALAAIVLAEVGLARLPVPPGATRIVVRLATVYFFFNLLANMASSTELERWVLGPVSLVLFVCLLRVALTRPSAKRS